jgi:5'(3')-deoxyribonucleotidase
MSYSTARWLKENGFPSAPIMCVGRERKKALLRNGFFDVVIDDHPRYLDSFRGKKFVHRRPWNINNGKTYDWKELKDEVLSLLRK